MYEHIFFKIIIDKKQKKIQYFAVFILAIFKKWIFSRGFIFQKIDKNRKNLENFSSQKFLPIKYFDIRARKISLYTSTFRACNFTYGPNLAPEKMDPQNQSACPIKKQLEALLFFLLLNYLMWRHVKSHFTRPVPPSHMNTQESRWTFQ